MKSSWINQAYFEHVRKLFSDEHLIGFLVGSFSDLETDFSQTQIRILRNVLADSCNALRISATIIRWFLFRSSPERSTFPKLFLVEGRFYRRPPTKHVVSKLKFTNLQCIFSRRSRTQNHGKRLGYGLAEFHAQRSKPVVLNLFRFVPPSSTRI